MAETVVSEQMEPGSARDLPGAVSQVYGDLRGRLDGDLLAVCAAADGYVWSVEEGGVLRCWDSENGRQIDAVPLSEVESCWAFSPDGRLLASGSNGIAIWDVPTATLLARLAEPSWMVTLAFSPDGRTVASGHDDNAVRLWDFDSGKLLHTLRGHSDEVCALSFSADGKRLATAGEDLLVFLWDVASGKRVQELAGHTDRVDAIAWSPTGHRIASAGWDTSVRVWDPAKGELLSMLNGQGECVHSVAFLPDGQSLICGDSDCVVRVWEYEKLKIRFEMKRHEGAVKHLALRADGTMAASGGTDRSLQFWNLKTGKANFDNQGSLFPVAAIAVSVKGELAALHADERLSRWTIQKAKQKPFPKDPANVAAIAVSSLGRWGIGRVDGTIDLVGPQANAKTLSWKAHERDARLLAFSKDGKSLASSAGSDGTVKLWNVADGEPFLIIPEATHRGTVEAIAFHPGQPILAAAGINWMGGKEADGCIALWDYEKRSLVRTIEGGASRVAFSPDGRLLASVSLYETVLVWNVQSGQLLRELAGRDDSANAVAFDPQGRFLASGSDDCGLRIWDARDWSLLCAFDLETCVKDLCFTPDGNAVLTGNGNTTCYLVDVENLS